MTGPAGLNAAPGKTIKVSAFEMLELPTELLEYLSDPTSNVLLVWGPTGSGKSSLSAELLRSLNGHLILVTPGGIGSDERLSELVGQTVDSRILHVNTQGDGHRGSGGDDLGGGQLFAAGIHEGDPATSRPPWVQSILGHLNPTDPSYIVVDHWRPGSQPRDGGRPDMLSTSASADRDIQVLRVALAGTASHLILLADLGPHDDPISSADGAIETGYEALSSGRIRLLSLHKLRGVQIRAAQYPYSLAEGRFRCAMPFPPEFRPPASPPDAPVGDRPGYLWPGTSEFVRVFGWLRHGAFSGIEIGNSVPDYVESAMAAPMVAHTLLTGGRVVWVHLPACLPEEIAEQLIQWVPRETISGGLRLLSAGGLESDPLLKDILMPLPVTSGNAPAVSPGTGARVSPAFTEAYNFLLGKPARVPALFVLSLNGLRALASVTGVHYDPATFPLIVARYAKIPEFHGFTFAPDGDPLGAAARSHAERVLRADYRHGRVFITGVRPVTLPQALSWNGSDPRYQLTQMS
jgi:GvpD gas vesicle protein